MATFGSRRGLLSGEKWLGSGAASSGCTRGSSSEGLRCGWGRVTFFEERISAWEYYLLVDLHKAGNVLVS